VVGILVSGVLWAGTASAGETVIPIMGDVPEGGGDHFRVPFDVPEGIVEVEVRHDDLSEANILDFGVEDPNGRRGWGGGNTEPAVVGASAASRSYAPGPIPAGTWNVLVGKAKIVDPPGQYALEIVLRTTPTLPRQTERQPYRPAAALSEEARWYAGDVHVHSVESGDARPPLDEIGTFARERGLDFVVVSDHNVHTALDFFADVQPQHPQLLFVPGVEFTTYAGHANGIGATTFVDHAIDGDTVTIEGAVQAYLEQGAVFTINHPRLDLGDLCIGCVWEHDLDPSLIGAMEIATGGLEPFGAQWTEAAIEFWDELCAMGLHVVPVGGSDDHRAGVDLSPFQSPIGSATTMVRAQRLDAAAIVEGIRNGRTVVKLQGPDDPMIDLGASEPIEGDTVRGVEITLEATITGAAGQQARLVVNGEPGALQGVSEDPQTLQWPITAPASGQDRYRVEVFVDGRRRVVTSHLWVEQGDPSGGTSTGPDLPTTTTGPAATTGTSTGEPASDGGTTSAGAGDDGGGCGCRVAPPGAMLLPLFVGLRRRRPSGSR
jgi:hypothetical protein